MCWIIEKINGYYCVGFYRPDGELSVYDKFEDEEEAEELCSYLNGGGI